MKKSRRENEKKIKKENKQKENETNFRDKKKKLIRYEEKRKGKPIRYEDFINKEETYNIQILTEIMNNKLIPESSYLDENKEQLIIIFEKLSTFDEKKKIYLDTILNEEEEIQKIFSERFKLFKLIKEEDKFDSKSEFLKIKEKYYKVKDYIEKAHKISLLLSLYFKETLKEEINKIRKIYIDYLDNDKEVKEWIYKESEIESFINEYEKKANLIIIMKEIKLFSIIYRDFTEETKTETEKFDRAKELLDECKIIFTDIYKGNQEILYKWQKLFKKERDNRAIEEEIKKLKDYYKIDEIVYYDDVAKNILILTKKNIYKNDIKYLQYFLKLFNVEETELSQDLNAKKIIIEDEDHLDFDKLKDINNFFEKIKLYVNNGKDDSQSIQLIRLLYNRENEIKFALATDVDSAATLMYRLNPTTDSLTFNDILQYQSCVDFVKISKEK